MGLDYSYLLTSSSFERRKRQWVEDCGEKPTSGGKGASALCCRLATERERSHSHPRPGTPSPKIQANLESTRRKMAFLSYYIYTTYVCILLAGEVASPELGFKPPEKKFNNKIQAQRQTDYDEL